MKLNPPKLSWFIFPLFQQHWLVDIKTLNSQCWIKKNLERKENEEEEVGFYRATKKSVYYVVY